MTLRVPTLDGMVPPSKASVLALKLEVSYIIQYDVSRFSPLVEAWLR